MHMEVRDNFHVWKEMLRINIMHMIQWENAIYGRLLIAHQFQRLSDIIGTFRDWECSSCGLRA